MKATLNYEPVERALYVMADSASSSREYHEVVMTGTTVFRFADNGDLLQVVLKNTPPELDARTVGSTGWHDGPGDGRNL